ncbi:MAG: YezD family protein [Cellvibrio sp.]|uniref:YezD family protein n=1 Tax=Cellvibrio sp. TaxID=1965322 RepID=UPI0031B39657
METHRTGQAAIPEDVLEEIKQQLALIQFGSLEIQVHNGQVVQVERREKKRWEKSVNTK